MGKQGPCYHCGVTSTPLWRNGPPEKPILCNACGSRWRTKGTLKNYTPLHSRGPLEMEEFSKPKRAYFKNEDQRLYRKKQDVNSVENECKVASFKQHFGKCFDEDLSNWSTSSSAVSYTESCSHMGSADSSNVRGTAQTSILEPLTKRIGTGQLKPSRVEKLTKELHSILHQQMPYLSRSLEEDLLYDNGSSMDSFEIGHGGVLIRHLNSEVPEEESEASSLPAENKTSYSIPSFPVHIQRSNDLSVDHERIESARAAQEHMMRNKLSQDKLKLNILQKRDSHMGFIDLRDAKHEDNLGGTAKGEKLHGCSITASRKRPHASQPQVFPEPKVLVRSPRRVHKTGVTGMPSITKSTEDIEDHEGSCFSPRSMFTSSDCTSSLTSLQFHDDNLYQDLLIDVPPNTSFPEAELLSDIWKQKTESKRVFADTEVSKAE